MSLLLESFKGYIVVTRENNKEANEINQEINEK